MSGRPVRRVETALRGRLVLGEAAINKGTAFTVEERAALGLDGLLPARIEHIEDQLHRVRVSYDRLHDDLERHIYLRTLQDSNEVLFYRFLRDNLVELLPVVYTPTVGDACQEFSRIYRRPHGLFISYPERDRMASALAAAPSDVDVIVVTDGERILGLGDQGLGGMAIPIGKLALYTAVGGIDPSRTLPVLLDVGTNNPAIRDDPLYLGWRHDRITGDDYDRFVADFVDAVKARWPHVLLQWEDFAQHHATSLLQAHRGRILSFNDDIQGTAAVALATVHAALDATGSDLGDARVVIVGAGSAGSGIARMLVDAGVDRARLYMIDAAGLLHDRRSDLVAFQAPFAQPWEAVADWADPGGPTSLETTVRTIAPNVLIGVSGQPGLFGEEMIRHVAANVEHPIVLPLSNPTSRAEATAAQLLAWTDGRAVVATGSPSEPVLHRGVSHTISQANNVYVFPGLGLGALVSEATSITDAMLRAAAAAVAEADPLRRSDHRGGILPALDQVIPASRRIALAVARAARADGVGAAVGDDTLEARIARCWWTPDHPEIVPR